MYRGAKPNVTLLCNLQWRVPAAINAPVGSAPFWQHSQTKYWAIMLQFGPIIKGVALINSGAALRLTSVNETLVGGFYDWI